MSPAQQAQQDNRTRIGRYAPRVHGEGDLDVDEPHPLEVPDLAANLRESLGLPRHTITPAAINEEAKVMAERWCAQEGHIWDEDTWAELPRSLVDEFRFQARIKLYDERQAAAKDDAGASSDVTGPVAGSVDDLEVASGRSAPEIVHGADGTRWERPDVYQVLDPYGMRLQANRPLSPAQAQQLAQLAGYNYSSTIVGEPLGWPEQDTPASIVVSADMTKTRRDDLGIAMEEFEERLPDMVRNGSPIRKTNRAGEGTKGTRLVEGMGEGLEITIYYS